MQLDSLLQRQVRQGLGGQPAHLSPVVQLSSQELHNNVLLLTDGLLGKGATALVFKCLWPSRFGPNALLAAKVVKNGFNDDARIVESFTYEANVLASVQHPNIVCLYGYCLEPPTLCLILELLPTSLKDVLYKGVPLSSQEAIETSSQAPALHIDITTNVTSSAATTTTVDRLDIPHNPLRQQVPEKQNDRAIEITVDCADESSADTAAGQGSQAQAEQQFPLPQASSSMSGVSPRLRLSCAQVVGIATDIACGLAYLHDNAAPMYVPEPALAAPTPTSDCDKGASVDLPGPTVAPQASTSTMATDPSNGLQLGIRGRIVHRDLKPANILINSQGVAKISDFGLARRHEYTTVPTVHLGVGTLPYMAPELLVASDAVSLGQTATNRVDVYSLAIMMWEMLSGRPPWKDMSEVAIMAAVTQRQRPALPDADVPKCKSRLQEVANQPASPAAIPQLNTIIRACWHQRDLRRPQASEVHAWLIELQQQMKTPQDHALEKQDAQV